MNLSQKSAVKMEWRKWISVSLFSLNIFYIMNFILNSVGFKPDGIQKDSLASNAMSWSYKHDNIGLSYIAKAQSRTMKNN